MLNTVKYSALSVKTRAMFGKLLKPSDYEELMQKKTVNEVASYLKSNTHFADALRDINENTIHRGRLESILKHDMAKDYKKLFKFARGDVAAFLRIAFLKYEIESLKVLFRVLETEGDTTLVKDSLLFLDKYNTLNLPKLAKSRNSQEFISNLKGTHYYDVLRPFLIEDTKNRKNLFNIEMKLDEYFLMLVFRKKKKLLKDNDEKIVDRSLGTEIDIFNILWIYRCKKFYNMDKEIIYTHIIPHRYKLTKKTFTALVEAKDMEEFQKIIAGTKYAHLFLQGESHYYELNFSEYMYRMHLGLLRRSGFTVASVLSYLHLKEFELGNIITVIEGIRYKLPKSRIRRFIVGFNRGKIQEVR